MTPPALGRSLGEMRALGGKKRALRVVGDGYTVRLTPVAANRKLGPMPVSMTDMASCPTSCALRDQGCYAEHGHTFMHWKRVATSGVAWSEFCRQIAALPDGTVWRHNEAGDLPGRGDHLDVDALGELVDANAGRRGFTYTHRPLGVAEEREAIRRANAAGFTVNLSANGLHDVDRLVALGVGPVVVTLPHDRLVPRRTAAGHRIVLCPADARSSRTDTSSMTCAQCKLCVKSWRKSVVAFLTHGSGKNFAAMVVRGGRASSATTPVVAMNTESPR